MTESNIPMTPSTSVTPTPPGGVAAPDHEIVYYEGRPMMRADQAKATFWVLVGLGFIVVACLSWTMDWGWPKWAGIVLFILGILAIVPPWLVIRATRYRITSYRIDFERGIIKKKIDTLELWHVDDIKFEQGLLDRMMNVGSITVMSNDRTNPKLELHGIPDPRKIFDALKDRVIAVKRQRGVIKMDVGV
jgi:membrane protein YdbS with pleckstrin-like domain